jgi:hypothetical protein
VVFHQTTSPQHPVEPFAARRHPIEKRLSVNVVDKDRRSRIATRHHGVVGVGEPEA